MLVIRVELHSAVTGKVSEIARMLLWNDGSGDSHTGSYCGKVVKGVYDSPMPPSAINAQPALREGSVTGYARKHLHVWNLVMRMLSSMGYK